MYEEAENAINWSQNIFLKRVQRGPSELGLQDTASHSVSGKVQRRQVGFRKGFRKVPTLQDPLSIHPTANTKHEIVPKIEQYVCKLRDATLTPKRSPLLATPENTYYSTTEISLRIDVPRFSHFRFSTNENKWSPDPSQTQIHVPIPFNLQALAFFRKPGFRKPNGMRYLVEQVPKNLLKTSINDIN